MAKEYEVYFEGRTLITADSEDEAIEEAYDILKEVGTLEFNINGAE